MTLRWRTLAICALLCGAHAVWAGPIYRWVDAKGRTHYSQTPPGDQKSQQVVVRAPKATPRPVSTRSTGGYDDSASVADLMNIETNTTTRKNNCKAAQDQIALLESTPPVRIQVRQMDGSVARMTDEQHSLQMNQAKRIAKDNCT